MSKMNFVLRIALCLSLFWQFTNRKYITFFKHCVIIRYELRFEAELVLCTLCVWLTLKTIQLLKGHQNTNSRLFYRIDLHFAFFAVGNADCADMWKSTAAAGLLGTYISIKNVLNVYLFILFIKKRNRRSWRYG